MLLLLAASWSTVIFFAVAILAFVVVATSYYTRRGSAINQRSAKQGESTGAGDPGASELGGAVEEEGSGWTHGSR